MDQIKIGKFIASCRKEQGMTQASLAEKLRISDRDSVLVPEKKKHGKIRASFL